MTERVKGPFIAWDDGYTIGIESADADKYGEAFPIAVFEVVNPDDMTSDDQMRADQAFAVRAMNSHDALVAALRAVVDHEPDHEGDRILPADLPVMQNIIAALAMARAQ